MEQFFTENRTIGSSMGQLLYFAFDLAQPLFHFLDQNFKIAPSILHGLP